MAGVQAHADASRVGLVEQPVDLVERLDVGRGMRVEDRLVPELRGLVGDPMQDAGECPPRRVVEARGARRLGPARRRVPIRRPIDRHAQDVPARLVEAPEAGARDLHGVRRRPGRRRREGDVHLG